MALSRSRKKQLARAAGRQLARFIRFVLKTSDVVMEPPDGQQFIMTEFPPIIAVWHGQFMMVVALKPEEFHADAMVARHGDAELIAEALLPFNMRLVRGAGSQGRKFKMERGGVAALRQAVRSLNDNRAIVITADVPPGPARVAGSGVITLAKLSGRPIIPVAVASSRYKSLNTWSRMTINLPYSKLGCAVGDMIWVDRAADTDTIEAKRLQLENDLNRLTTRAYQLAGADELGATPISAIPRTAPVPEIGGSLRLYRAFTRLVRPVAPALYAVRAARGKEDPKRKNERYGIASELRPASGPIVWVHAASVGETNAVLPVIHELLSARKDCHVVLTTGTVTSAALAKQRLPERAIHQFVPFDSPKLAERFLNHWQPDLAIFTESEIWPNLILEAARVEIPLALVNGRMSKRSHARWRKNRGVSLPLFARFDIVLAQNAQMAKRFSDLGARNVITAGNLKVDAPAPPYDPAELEHMRAALGGRKFYVAASTHEGEEQQIIDAHRRLQQTHENPCTIIVPRHPERGMRVGELAKSMGLRVCQRSLERQPDANTDVYVADTIGELGLFYALSDIAFVGGSLINHGGQNPLEAVRHDAAIVSGPSQHNFSDIYRALDQHRAVRVVDNGNRLAEAVGQMWSDTGLIADMIAGGHRAVDDLGGALRLTIDELLSRLPSDLEKDHSRAAE